MSDHLYKMVLFVGADQLGAVHKAVGTIAAITEISDWYEPEPETLADELADEPHEETPTKVPSGMTLVQQVLHHAKRKNGVTRAALKEIAKDYGFNVGSISPTLVKLMKAKRIKRLSPGVYVATGK